MSILKSLIDAEAKELLRAAAREAERDAGTIVAINESVANIIGVYLNPYTQMPEPDETADAGSARIAEYPEEVRHGPAKLVRVRSGNLKAPFTPVGWFRMKRLSEGLPITESHARAMAGFSRYIDTDEKIRELGASGLANLIAFGGVPGVKWARSLLETQYGEPMKLKKYEARWKAFAERHAKYDRSELPQLSLADTVLAVFRLSEKSSVTKGQRMVKNLKPAQRNIDEARVIRAMTDPSQTWRDRIFVVSEDGYIVDGHCDWALGLELDPDFRVTVFSVGLPLPELVRRLKLMKLH